MSAAARPIQRRTADVLPLVSVVIPTHRRPELLSRCLNAIAQHTLPWDAVEVIVVDDDADGVSTAGLAQAGVRGLPRLKLLRTRGRQGPATARNLGWRAASAAVIAFTDDDTLPAPRWLAAGLDALDRSGAVALWGRIIVPTPSEPTDYERNTQGLEAAEFATANVFVRRDALQRLGGFDERFGSPWREDADLYFTLLTRAGAVVHAPDAVVVHPIRPARRGECLRQHRHQVYDALLYRKHPQLYRKKICPAVPWGYYLTVAAALATALLALAGPPGAWRWTLLLALLPITLLAFRRLAGTSRAAADRLEVLLTSVAIPFVAVYWRLRGALRFRVLFL
jgi:GT2 family glycosyltransferase